MARKVVERNISYDDIRKKYYVNLDYGIIDGKRKKKIEVFIKKSDARRRLTEFQHQKNTTGVAALSDDTLADWLDYWLENIVKINNEVTTYESYKNIIKYLKADMAEPPKYTKPEISVYSVKEIKQLFGVVEDDIILKTAVSLAALLGLRREEICGLKWSNVDFETKEIHIIEAKLLQVQM